MIYDFSWQPISYWARKVAADVIEARAGWPRHSACRTAERVGARRWDKEAAVRDWRNTNGRS